jgi:hypothetical protein
VRTVAEALDPDETFDLLYARAAEFLGAPTSQPAAISRPAMNSHALVSAVLDARPSTIGVPRSHETGNDPLEMGNGKPPPAFRWCRP